MSDIIARAKSIAEFESREVQWLIPYWIPKGAITLLAGSGGIGKTNLWCYLLACISGMQTSVFHNYGPLFADDEEPAQEAAPASEEDLAFMNEVLKLANDRKEPSEIQLEMSDVIKYFELLRRQEETGTQPADEELFRGQPYNMSCMYFSAEDPPEVLKKKFEDYEADTENIITVDYRDIGKLSFASKELEELIAEYRPAICVFDPMQAFMPHGHSMTSRQQAREALDHLVRLGEEYKTAFLLVCHTNKKRTDDWRQKISGSADLPDIARSVIFTDYTELAPQKKIRFISNEKNSYHEPEETLLYSFEKGKLVFRGVSGKKFADYAHDEPYSNAGPRRMTQTDFCKQTILKTLEKQGELSSSELNKVLKDEGFARKATDSAKAELEAEGKAERFCISVQGKPQWRIRLKKDE